MTEKPEAPVVETDPAAPGEPGAPEAEPGKIFTQTELDKIVQREKRRAAEAERKRLEDEAKQAAQTAEERLTAEKEAAEKRAQDAVTRANVRVIAAEAKAQAVALGIKPERIRYALRLADLAEVEVGDDGEPDANAIKAALEAVLKDLPELAPTPSGGAGIPATPKPAGNLSREERVRQEIEIQRARRGRY